MQAPQQLVEEKLQVELVENLEETVPVKLELLLQE